MAILLAASGLNGQLLAQENPLRPPPSAKPVHSQQRRSQPAPRTPDRSDPVNTGNSATDNSNSKTSNEFIPPVHAKPIRAVADHRKSIRSRIRQRVANSQPFEASPAETNSQQDASPSRAPELAHAQPIPTGEADSTRPRNRAAANNGFVRQVSYQQDELDWRRHDALQSASQQTPRDGTRLQGPWQQNGDPAPSPQLQAPEFASSDPQASSQIPGNDFPNATGQAGSPTRTYQRNVDGPDADSGGVRRVIPRKLRQQQRQDFQQINSGLQSAGFSDPSQEPGIGGLRSSKSCEEYRESLLDNPITDIVLDISALKPLVGADDVQADTDRQWRDRCGKPLATGTLQRLERSYAVISDEAGNLQQVHLASLADADLAEVAKVWGLPTECTLGCFEYQGRLWQPATVTWYASNLCHKPLRMEDVQLERYGHSAGPVLQPIRSTVHFFTRLTFWPYMQGIHPTNECLYSLGYYRPGNCAPWLVDPVPFSRQGSSRMLLDYTAKSFLF